MLVDAGAAVNGIWNHRTNLSLAIDKGYSEIADFLRASGARLPSELNSIQTDKVVPSLKDETIDTFSRHFGTPLDAAQYSLISGSPPGSIHVIPANPRCNYITLFTVGLAEQPMYVPAVEKIGGEQNSSCNCQLTGRSFALMIQRGAGRTCGCVSSASYQLPIRPGLEASYVWWNCKALFQVSGLRGV